MTDFPPNHLPIVSIITPAHNAARFLDETIRSVSTQTFSEWEMLVVDDASADTTSDIVTRWSEIDPRIRLIRLAVNQGAALARNRALIEARGRFVAFLDSDDLWKPHKLETQTRFMKDTGAVFTFAGYSVVDENGRPIGRAVRAPREMDYRSLLKNTAIGCLTVMLDREAVGPLKMRQLPQHEDLVLWYEILKRGTRARGIQEDLASYRVVRGSASRNKFRSALHMWRVLRQEERLGVLDAAWCYAHYAWNAYRKNRV
jgi:teichuronic acid biosynthesis glycosyltransferase TuaG